MGTSNKPRDDRPIKGGDKWYEEIKREMEKASRRSEKPTVFISYSHKDEAWKDRLLPQLRALEMADRIVIWHDRKIDGGDKWYPEIEEAMGRAAVAVCLISPDFLSSDFCVKEEVPYLLERRERDGMILLPLLLRPCTWQAFPWLSEIQMLPRDGKSVYADYRDREEEVFAELAGRIFEIVNNPDYRPPAPPPPPWSPPEKIDISRLPVTASELFGRQKELELLDAAWSAGEMNVVSLVAWGGVGKSTLVNKWLERLEADNYRGARRVFAWSFYSQGTGERVTSADQFINAALIWFGDADPTAGSPWDKGERLARLVQQEKTLLLLDGLEPLQSPHAHERGKIKDPGLLTLLTELARRNPGFCLITTRERVTDLTEYEPKAVLHKDLEQISDDAGRALLRVGGVRGTDAELEQAVRDFGNHALAVQLLAVYLHDIPGHHVSHAAEIPDLDIPDDAGRHPRRVMQALAARFGDNPEVELLRMLGLFDRPADRASMRALRRAPAIRGLTNRIRKLTDAGWIRTIDKLRQYKLIASRSTHRQDDLDAHPLVREHFGQQLKQLFPNAWRAGNYRLYQHLKRTTKVFPSTIEEMAPLYVAVAHGCESGRHQEAFDEVFVRRIHRGDEHFSINNLGTFGAELTMLSNFFVLPWRDLVSSFTGANKILVLGIAGFNLKSLGQLNESTQPMQAALEAAILQNSWTNVGAAASNLRETYLAIGNLSQALIYARKGVEYSERSEYNFRRIVASGDLANTLHQLGDLIEAEAAFRKAEKMQQEFQPHFPFLYSLGGFMYCDLLLDQGKYEEVKTRTEQTLANAISRGRLSDIALDYISIGRAHLLQAQREAACNFDEATGYLTRGVNGLRQAGKFDYLPIGLLSRAELYRAIGEFSRAQTDVDEAMSIVLRGGMGLYEADCHLEYARLYLARGERERARESWERARAMIERMGYHRRDRDVREIEEELMKAGG